MITALLIMTAMTGEPPGPAPLSREALIREATGLLLAGESVPADIDARLMALSPADRIEVLIFLRRSGMLQGPGWTADRLLAPARTGEPLK